MLCTEVRPGLLERTLNRKLPSARNCMCIKTRWAKPRDGSHHAPALQRGKFLTTTASLPLSKNGKEEASIPWPSVERFIAPFSALILLTELRWCCSDGISAPIIGMTILIRNDCLWLVAYRA
jgi:hypothetical protein